MSDPLNVALQTIADSLPNYSKAEYHRWIQETEPTDQDISRIQRRVQRLRNLPSVELLIAAGDDEFELLSTLERLSQQVWKGFSIGIGCLRSAEVYLERLLRHYVRRRHNQPLARLVAVDAESIDSPFCVEQALLQTSCADYVAFIAQDDILAPHALAEVALALSRRSDTAIIFTDDDWIDARGERSRPHFRHGWDPDAQLGFDLMGRFSPMLRERALVAGGLRSEAGLAAHYDLHCRIAAAAGPSRILHLASVLRHVARSATTSREAAEKYAADSRAVAREVAPLLGGARVVVGPAPLAPSHNRISWPLPNPAPLVSILIPTRDRAELLKVSALGVLQKTDYPAIELLILDNGSVEADTFRLFDQLKADSRVRVLDMAGPFNFSKLNNDGAAAARGKIIVLLNNDVEIIEPGWLREMAALAMRREIGCVGAKLLYGDRRIQHAGVNMAPHTGCAHVGRLMREDDPGHGGSLAVTRTHSAVTAACLAIRAEVLEEVGGLDEVAFEIGYNDVDLCLRVRDHGYRSICTPFATLLHLESVSRGPNDDPEKQARERAESTRIIGRWREVFLDDPYQNPNTLLTWEGVPRLTRSRRLHEWEG